MKQLFYIICLLFSFQCNAGNDALNETLVRIINQLNAIMPLLNQAENERNPNARIQLQIESFEDEEGRHHAGLREDILAIRRSLIDYINTPAIAPQKVKPLAMDFVRKP